MKQDQERELIKKHQDRQKRILKVLGTTDGEQLLADLEEHFEVNLPAFQGSHGKYDPLDAMRRDAYREVFLYCRHQLKAVGEKTNNQPQNT